ncbi:hypothetical protein CRE_06997 [Caenorhabditis remanei]|uniref:Uncharacterized protein n=1 Tax=Caenorhabditis remanei TaxID=31234 RepID=E3NB41_CAERE|nr:hypothetical protein CRE_06997 [Caenorhabditis remanei]
MSDFYITLPSSVPNSQFPNTSSRYVTRLPDVLTLERDKYRVAATDIIYPYSFVNVGKALDFWIHYRPAASSSPPRIPRRIDQQKPAAAPPPEQKDPQKPAPPEKKDQEKPAAEKKDQQKPAAAPPPEQKDPQKPAPPEKKDQEKPAAEKKDQQKPAAAPPPEQKDPQKPAPPEKKDQEKPAAEKKDKQKPVPTEKKDQKKPEEKKDQKKPAAEKKDQQKPAPTEKKDQKKPAPTEKKDQKTPAPAGAETKKEETIADWNRQFESLSGGTPAGGETTTPPESVADLNRQFMSLSGKPKPAPPENQPTQQPAPPIVQKKGDGDDDDSVASWNRQFESLGTRGETIDAWNQQFLSLEKQRAEHDEAWPLYAASSMLLLHNKSTDPTTYQQQVEEFRKLRAKISTSHTSTSRGLLHFSNVGDQIKIEFLDGDISFVEFDETCAYFLGFTDPIVTKSQPAHKKVDYFGNVSTLYLYCDVVDPIIVGNTKSSLLSVIPCRGAYGEMIHHTVTHPRYLPLMNSTIDSIRVELLTEFGEPIDFNWGSTIIVLHFKRIE